MAAKKRVKRDLPAVTAVDGMVLDQQFGSDWAAYHGDSVEVVKAIPDHSVDHIIYSPPFASLYTYSASDRDLGNCKTHSEFHEHYGFLLGELLRIIRPGRIMGVHCMALPTSKSRDGYVGLTDFPGVIIAAAERAGWIYHADVVIWKDPVTAMQRTKALGLLHKQLKKDSCMSRMGIPDRLLFFRAPGENTSPVEHTAESFPVEHWQRYASPVWALLSGDQYLSGERQCDGDGFAICSADVDPNDTLQYQSAREHDDERHICPLQLEVIKRSLRMYSNPGDVVFSPFMGIGSEGWVSLKNGRKFVGIELKRSYYQQAVANLSNAVSQLSLFWEQP